MKIIQGFFKLFEKCPAEATDTTDTTEAIIERVQRAMLSALECYCDAIDQSLDTRISRASNLDDLWYLRPNLMSAISAHKGESVAQAALTEITCLFEWPAQRAALMRR